MSSIKNPLADILDSNKFTGLNYQDWLRNLKIVLASEKLLYTLEKIPPKEALADASPEELEKLDKWWDDELKTRCYVIASMSNEMQWRIENTEYAAGTAAARATPRQTRCNAVRHFVRNHRTKPEQQRDKASTSAHLLRGQQRATSPIAAHHRATGARRSGGRDCGSLRQSGPRPDPRLLRQAALEALTRSARTDSPRRTGRKQFSGDDRRRRRRRV
ncbi:hypothetical protein F511_36031 [Dorcoceras hygrometricum]|uniref:Uncharacterized protein n=1 Tax=Dorcoceras hygrometricum TaxID=472368 RepID=A0A2Z7D3G6_9LAMI|nr:hypothetical protein F511_36031 [Dorcoceras hygrometricum]